MMEPIYFYFQETPLDANNKFMINFSNTQLVYQIKSSPKSDYYIKTVNFNLIIASDYGDVNTRYKRSIRKTSIIARKRPSLPI